MSHRLIDEMARLRVSLAAVEADIETVRARSVVDFDELRDLRNTRDVLRVKLAAAAEEEAIQK